MNQIDHNPGGKKLRLDKGNAKMAGVCAGLANYFGTDPLLIRALFVVGALAGFGTFIVLYIALALIVD